MTGDVQFGRYRGDRLLGSGAFATVWLAHDDVLEAPVAVKVLADNWAHHLDVCERFREEARILRRADSDRVVRVHDIGALPDGRPYFVMTYADRGSLADRAADRPVPPAAAAHYVREAARGVAVLHQLGVVHRDLTPSNVLLRSAGAGERVLIADLGLAKALARASGLTVVAGTPGYAAPEQAAGDSFDERADVYALGALAWRLVSGQPPPLVRPGEPALPRLTGAPAALTDAVARALDPDPAGRWASAAAFAAALDPVAEPADPGAGEPTPGRTGTSADAAEPATQLLARPAERTTAVVGTGGQPATAAPRAGDRADAGSDPAQGTAPPTTGEGANGRASTSATALGVSEADADWARRTAAERRRIQAKLRRRRRARRIAIGVVLAALAAAGGAAGWWRYVAPVTVRDSTGTLQLTVPSRWAGEARGSAWPLDRYGLPGRTGVGVTVAPDVGDWSDTRSDVPGVFVGVSRDLVSVREEDLAAPAQHRQCTGQDTQSYANDRLTGSVVRWTGCAGGPVTFSEAVLRPRAGGYVLVVQIKQAGGADRTTELLDSIQVVGTV